MLTETEMNKRLLDHGRDEPVKLGNNNSQMSFSIISLTGDFLSSATSSQTKNANLTTLYDTKKLQFIRSNERN